MRDDNMQIPEILQNINFLPDKTVQHMMMNLVSRELSCVYLNIDAAGQEKIISNFSKRTADGFLSDLAGFVKEEFTEESVQDIFNRAQELLKTQLPADITAEECREDKDSNLFNKIIQEKDSMHKLINISIPRKCILSKASHLTRDNMISLLHHKPVKIYQDDSDFRRMVLRCKECGQLYFFEYYEVRYDDDEDMHWTYIPIRNIKQADYLNTLRPISINSFTAIRRDFMSGHENADDPFWAVFSKDCQKDFGWHDLKFKKHIPPQKRKTYQNLMKKAVNFFLQNSFDEAIDLLLILLDKCKKRLRDKSRNHRAKKQLYTIYRDLSWCYLLNNQPMEAFGISGESYGWDAMLTSTKIHRAHSLLLLDSQDKALECYRDLISPDRLNVEKIKELILKDFDDLEKYNIYHPDFAKIREMLK